MGEGFLTAAISVLLLCGPLYAQTAPPSAPPDSPSGKSATASGTPADAAPAASGAGLSSPRPAATSNGGENSLPVSLNHIRNALARMPERSLLEDVDVPADFRIEILEQRRLDEMISKLDFKAGPVPAGGLYAYEQQRLAFSPTAKPLMQPYAAFNGSELITIALENLIFKYLGGRALNAVSAAERSAAERAARREVDEAIAEYCAARPDRAEIQLCAPPDR